MITQQLKRFLIVGFTTVAIDFAFYRLFLFIDTPTDWAKGIGFIAGTIFAYFANKLWTFNRARGGSTVFTMFIVLYLTTLSINVGVNNLVISTLGSAESGLAAGFLIATGTSATLNFLGMRVIVFRGEREPNS